MFIRIIETMSNANNMVITYRNGYQAIVVTYSADLESCEIDTIGINDDDLDILIDQAVIAQGTDFGGFVATIS